jgi:hypothetical protein
MRLSLYSRKENMRITIIQSEIEEAIREKVLSQMSINDGMVLEIDLSATRGDDGFTAEINIIPEAATKTATKKTPAKKKAAPAPEKAKDKAEPVEEPDQAEEAPVEQEAAETPEVEAEASVQMDEAPAKEVPAEESKPTGSIFGGLKKPVNN